jgi:hypothetical protein
MGAFPYFGAKGRLAHLYPRPEHDTIIEPFAGSAAYAFHADHWTRLVILVEKHPMIADLWRWLQKADPADIWNLPDMVKGESLEAFGLPGTPQRTLANLTAPSEHFHKNVVTEWMVDRWDRVRSQTALTPAKIRHWQIIEGDYTDAPDIEATWFIDPPYQKIVHGYDSDRQGIDFPALGDWCQSRQGQVIVCEEDGADWLPFEPLTEHKTIAGDRKVEVAWFQPARSDTLF